MKGGTRVLESPITMEEGMGIRLYGDGGIEAIKDELVVIVVANGESNDSAVIEIQDGAQIELVNHGASIPLELCHVGQPLHVRGFCVEFAVQVVLRHMSRGCRTPGTSVPPELDGRLNVKNAVDAENTLVVDVNIMESVQFIPDSAMAHIWMYGVNFLNLVGNALIFLLTAALGVLHPAVVG